MKNYEEKNEELNRLKLLNSVLSTMNKEGVLSDEGWDEIEVPFLKWVSIEYMEELLEFTDCELKGCDEGDEDEDWGDSMFDEEITVGEHIFDLFESDEFDIEDKNKILSQYKKYIMIILNKEGIQL